MYPECLVLPKSECVNMFRIRNVTFHNLSTSGDICDTCLGWKGLPYIYLGFGILCKIFRCAMSGKVDS